MTTLYTFLEPILAWGENSRNAENDGVLVERWLAASNQNQARSLAVAFERGASKQSITDER